MKSAPFIENKKYIRIEEEIIGEVKNQEEEEELIGDGNYIDEPEIDKKQLSPEFKYCAKKYQDYLLSEKNNWTAIKYVKDLKISACDFIPSSTHFSLKMWKIVIKPIFVLLIAFLLLKYFLYDISELWFVVFIPLIIYLRISKMVIIIPRKSKMLRSVTAMNWNSAKIASFLTDAKIRKSFDTMHVNIAHAADKDSNGEAFIWIEYFKVPPSNNENLIEPKDLPVLFWKYKWLHFSDESLTHFIIRKGEKWDEWFIIIPFVENPDESLVYYYSEFAVNPSTLGVCQDNPLFIQYMQEKRFELLCDLKQFWNKQNRNKNQIVVKEVEKRQTSHTLHELLEEAKKREMTFDERSMILWKEFVNEPTSESIIIVKGERYGMDLRFPDYIKTKHGHLWCNDQNILNSQKGILIDLVKRAGKKLMEGKGVVAVSLPVRLFERRSTVERMCDLWSTGPIFLLEAARSDNPVERMKKWITFFISGLHMSVEMRKPFNPIIGETFEACWPDNSKIYVEHISHHPPISYFLVEHNGGLYKFYGSYEYTAKLTDFGNSATGRQVGKNYIEFKDGTKIVYEFPYMKIGGLLFGKRTIKFSGKVEFTDQKNGLNAVLKFNSEGGMFKKKEGLVDEFKGEITWNGTSVR